MLDIKDVTFEIYATEYAEEAGYIIDPKSDEKEVFIPSPPTKVMTKINPRAGIILFTDEPVSEESENLDKLKAFAKEQKQFLACVGENSVEAAAATYDYMISGAKTLNIKKSDIQVRYMGEAEAIAQEFVDYLVEEMDVEIEDAESLVV